MVFPTPWDDINAVLLDLTNCIQAILGSQFVGLYLYGSLALGDFDPQASDIDFIVVTQFELHEDLITALRAMHARFDHGNSPWAGRIEAAYIPLAAMKYSPSTTTCYPQIEKGTELFLAPLEIGWSFQRYTLREQGVVVAGPKPALYTDPVEMDEMQRSAEAVLSRWQEQACQDPGWIDWVRQRSCQAFVVLTICRILYSLETGSVASKPAAAHWARLSLGSYREALILRALTSQQDKQEITEREFKETLDFLDEALKRIQEKRSPTCNDLPGPNR